MDYGDYYWGFCRDYYRDPFPHSLLSSRQTMVRAGEAWMQVGGPLGPGGFPMLCHPPQSFQLDPTSMEAQGLARRV